MANTSLSLASLDFLSLKESFKTYLKSQAKYKDYDFEGSNINVLLDIFSYNTYLNAFYLNMVNSEMFLDSAQLRNSVISHAKELNYLPRSRKSAKAVINMTVKTSGIDTFVVPKGTKFNASSGYDTFVFSTAEASTYRSSDNTFVINNLEIYEGNYVNPADAFLVDYRKENQRFILSNIGIDTDSINVQVSENSGVTYEEYKLATNLYDLDNQSKIYFIQATEDNKYEIVFGDGVFGYRPTDASVVSVTYRISSGELPVGVYTFTMDDDLAAFNGGNYRDEGTTISIVAQPSGGAIEESIESIRFRAPRHFQTQERAISEEDYKILVLDNFPEVKDVNVYGGQDVSDSVQYGRTFIVPSTFSGTVLTNSRKADIKSFLDRRSALGIEAFVIDPDFLYIDLNTTVYIDFQKTSFSAAQIQNLIKQAIINYNDDNLEKFNTAFRYSNLNEYILAATDGVVSTESSFDMKKIISPALNVPVASSFSFNNRINEKEPINSSSFSLLGRKYYITNYIENPLTGVPITLLKNTLYLVQINPNISASVDYSPIGTVNYITGEISLNNLSINNFDGSSGVVFTAKALSQDIFAKKNDIIQIDLAQGVTIQIVDIINQ